MWRSSLIEINLNVDLLDISKISLTGILTAKTFTGSYWVPREKNYGPLATLVVSTLVSGNPADLSGLIQTGDRVDTIDPNQSQINAKLQLNCSREHSYYKCNASYSKLWWKYEQLLPHKYRYGQVFTLWNSAKFRLNMSIGACGNVVNYLDGGQDELR
jgi:hypothetical protein